MSTPLPQVSGGIFADAFIWARRLLKSPSTQAISDATLADYLNRFINFDLAERVQLQEFKRQYTFETVANIFEYQAPFTQALTPKFPGNSIPAAPPFIQNPPANAQQPQTLVPVYNMFKPPIYADGIQMGWYQNEQQFYNVFPELVLNEVPILGNGTAGPYTLSFSRSPILRAFIDELGNLLPYVYITALDSSGNQMYIVDSGYVDTAGLGILIQTDSTFQNIIGPLLTGSSPNAGGSGRINYVTGAVTFTFTNAVALGDNINTQTSPFSSGFPRICLFFNNIFKLYPVPDRPYKIQVEAYVTPSVFFNTQSAMPFAYMTEYIVRGACQKILSDMGDWEQFDRYGPLFKDQENLVLRRTGRQNATQRTPTIYSAQTGSNPYIYAQY